MNRPARIDAGPIIELTERRGCKPTGRSRWTQAWNRMRRAGTVTVGAADAFCVEVLGEHPAAVYGFDWGSAA